MHVKSQPYYSELDHLRSAYIGRRVQRNGSAEVAEVIAVRKDPTGGNNHLLQLKGDGRRVSAEEWTVIR